MTRLAKIDRIIARLDRLWDRHEQHARYDEDEMADKVLDAIESEFDEAKAAGITAREINARFEIHEH